MRRKRSERVAYLSQSVNQGQRQSDTGGGGMVRLVEADSPLAKEGGISRLKLVDTQVSRVRSLRRPESR